MEKRDVCESLRGKKLERNPNNSDLLAQPFSLHNIIILAQRDASLDRSNESGVTESLGRGADEIEDNSINLKKSLQCERERLYYTFIS